jgi:multicomponent Na+:H+ antiporter subunit D
VGVLLILAPALAVLLLNLPLRRIPGRLALPLVGALSVAEGAAALAAGPGFWDRTLLFAGVDFSAIFSSSFPVDGLARVMFLSLAIVGLCSALVARYTLPGRQETLRFANLVLLAMAGLNGIVLMRDLLSLWVFLEITALSSFILIVLERGKAALEGAFKYLVLSAVATSILLAGLALLFIVAGGTSFDTVAAALADGSTSRLTRAAVAFFVAGLAVKAGLVPFHGWLPDAYASAPPAVSVLLAGIVTKTTGVYTLIRLVDAVFGYGAPIRGVLLALGLLSAAAGAIGALGQRDLKRMLAYSSISQVGYIAMGLSAGPGLGLAGALFHLFNHAVFKSLLFVNSAAVEQESGTRDMDRLGGIAARMPVTATTSVLAMLSTAGIPPLAGFWSKLVIVIALWRTGQPWAAAAAVGVSVLTLAYFVSMQRRVFFGKLAESCAELREANGWALVPTLLLAAITVAVGLAAPWIFDSFLLPVGSIL